MLEIWNIFYRVYILYKVTNICMIHVNTYVTVVV